MNGSDYTLIDNAFNSQGASLAAEVAAKATRVVSASAAAVPAQAAPASTDWWITRKKKVKVFLAD